MKKISLQKKDKIYISIIAVLVLAIVALSAAWIITAHKEANVDKFKAYYNAKCSSYATQNLNLAKGQIVFIGDSITDLCPLDDYYADLDLACYNRGIGGDTTDGVLARLDVSAFDISPSKIVLLIGGNDVNGGRNKEYILANYRKILDTINKNLPEAELYFVSMIPQNRDIESYSTLIAAEQNAKIKSINAELPAICEEFGYKYVDLYPALEDENGYLRSDCSDDGLHLNALGFEIWSNMLKQYLN